MGKLKQMEIKLLKCMKMHLNSINGLVLFILLYVLLLISCDFVDV